MTINQALLKAVEAYKSGDVAAAKRLFSKIIQIEPNQPDANSNMGAILVASGDLEEALPYFQTALEADFSVAQYWFNYIEALFKLGRFTEASELMATARNKGCKGQAFDVLQEKLNSPAAAFKHNINGLRDLIGRGSAEEALLIATKLLENWPSSVSILDVMATANQKLGNLDAYVAIYDQILKLKPDDDVAYNNMGIVLAEQDKLEEAVEAFSKALSINSSNAETYNNLGNALQKQGQFEEAVEAYKKSVSINPDNAETYNNMGTAIKEQGELAEAIEVYKKAIAIKPDYAEAYTNLGSVLKDQGKLKEAMEAYNKSTSLKPDNAEAYNNMGVTLADQGMLEEAIEAYKKALSINPDYEGARAEKLYHQAHICDWNDIVEDRKLIPDLGTSKKFITPFSMLFLEDAPNRHLLRAEIYAKAKYPQKPLPLPAKPLEKPKRIRIGYFSSDFQEHPVAYLIAKVLEQHNRDKFEVFGYSLHGSSSSDMRQRLKNSFDCFTDFQGMSDKDIALRARQDEIDIAIDLNGYSKNSRTGLFAYRSAPIQISYLGYPSTMGADFMDYIIADENLIPTTSQKYYSEKLLYLPNTYMATDDGRELSKKPMNRSDEGLPNDAFVFCCFNNNYKISSAEFGIWMRLLNKVEGSVLWLRQSNKLSRQNLQNEARKQKIDPTRIVFADRAPMDEHLSRQSLADLFIDTFSFNAHTTATEALWAGLPVVTKAGQGFAARVAGSILNAVGLPELITENEENYEALILDLATNPTKLAKVKEKLASNRVTHPLFDTELYTKHLEEGYQRAYQNYFEGKAPQTIIVQK